jgi:fatty acid desaturase
MRPETAFPAILADIAALRHYTRAHALTAEIKSLHRPVLWRPLLAATTDWAMIFVAFAAVLRFGALAVPPAMLVVGNRQRALGNLLHDAAHGNFGRSRRTTDRVARWLLFRPMWTSLELYRREHFAHHRLLGVPGYDVDLIHCEADMQRSWADLLWHHATNCQAWKGATFGHLPRAPARETGLMLALWGGFLLAIALLISPIAALGWVALWLGSRATTFHLITTFREISDHVGLRPGTVIGFARNHTAGGVLGALLHPHNNGYHLLHHLSPGMPYYALPRAHALLLAWPEYAAATHCGRYFRGDTALVRSWVRGGERDDPGAAVSVP